jgi:hypothetical protein
MGDIERFRYAPLAGRATGEALRGEYGESHCATVGEASPAEKENEKEWEVAELSCWARTTTEPLETPDQERPDEDDGEVARKEAPSEDPDRQTRGFGDRHVPAAGD